MSIFSALDVMPVEQHVAIGGKTYRLKFNMRTLGRAEQLYAMEYERDVNVQKILGELLLAKSSAIMAVCYCALVEGGATVTWDTFATEMFGSSEFDPLFDAATTCITQMFKLRGDDDADEATEKN